MVHDDQLQFDRILKDAKRTVETSLGGKPLPFRYADYGLVQSASLVFRRSHGCVGIQGADVLAGFVMRYVQDGLAQHAPPTAPRAQAFQGLLFLTDAERGAGLNFVLANRDLERLGVAATPGFRMDFEALEVAGFPA
jgi:hypothetical protein